jgi:hypothetical protein
MQGRATLSRAIAQSMRALALGIVVGVLLTASFEFAKAGLRGPNTLLPSSAVVEASVLFSLYYALVICLICVPVWLALHRLRLASPSAAALLGFTATLCIWTVNNVAPSFTRLQVIELGLPYALFGGVAGVAVWWANSAR